MLSLVPRLALVRKELACWTDIAHSREKKVLFDLFCGAGGAGKGYENAGFELVGFDTRDQPRNPHKFYQLNALYVLEDGLCELADAIHASPPCKMHTQLKHLRDSAGLKPSDGDFLADTRDLLEETGKLWIIENVPNAPMRIDAVLCGTQFGLKWGGKQLQRHRWFEANFKLSRPGCKHKGAPWGVFGRLNDCLPSGSETPPTLDAARALMGISWMNWHELKESIPPAFTEHLGSQMLARLEELDECTSTALALSKS